MDGPDLSRAARRAAVVAVLVWVALTSLTATPGGAAAPAVTIASWSTDRYVRPDRPSTEVEYCLSEAAVVDVVVLDPTGAVVRHLVDDVARPASTCDSYAPSETWDLRDDSGARVPDAVYEVEVRATNDDGTGTATTARGVSSGPIAEFAEPEEGAVLTGVVTASLQVDPSFLAVFTPNRAEISCSTGSIFTELGSTTEVGTDGLMRVEADSSVCEDGEGRLAAHLRFDDPFGVRHEIIFLAYRDVTFTNLDLPEDFEATLVDTPTSAYSYTWEDPVPVRVCLSRVADVTAVVRDASGAVIRDLSPPEPMGPSECGPHLADVVTWDHRDAAGALVDDGTYTIELTAVDASGQESPAPSRSLAVTRHVSQQVPGTLVSPAPGAVLSGIEHFVVERDPGLDPAATIGVVVVGCPAAFSAGLTSPPPDATTISVQVGTTMCQEGPQTFRTTIGFSDPDGAVHLYGIDLSATVVNPTIVPGVGEVVEGDGGSVVVHVPVRLSAPSPRTITAGWRAVDGTATAGSDFVAVTGGTVTFAPGQTETSVAVTVNADDLAETDEVAFVRFASPTNARLGGLFGLGFGMVLDDDSGPRARLGSVTVDEGVTGTTTVASLPITLSEPSAQPVTVTWRTLDHGAVAPGDYLAASGSVTFAPGQTAATIDLTIVGDAADEADEPFAVALTGATGGSVGGWLGAGFVVVADDD